MKNFWNPAVIERMDPVWDYQLQDALLHFRGGGKDLPDPEIRQWWFKNGYGVQAITSREFLMVGELCYDVATGFVRNDQFVPFRDVDLGAAGLPATVFGARECLTVKEVEAFLEAVKNYVSKNRSEVKG